MAFPAPEGSDALNLSQDNTIVWCSTIRKNVQPLMEWMQPVVLEKEFLYKDNPYNNETFGNFGLKGISCKEQKAWNERWIASVTKFQLTLHACSVLQCKKLKRNKVFRRYFTNKILPF